MRNLLSIIRARALTGAHLNAIGGLETAPRTYSQCLDQIEHLAGFLSSKGLKRNDRVAIVLPNGPGMALWFLAASSVATSAPLNPAYTVEEFRFYLSDLNARAVIVAESSARAAEQAASELCIPIFRLSPDGLLPSMAEAHGMKLPEEAIQWSQENDVALTLHTSGTTARPKIVPLSHRNLLNSAEAIASSLHLTPGDRCLNVMPLFHVHGLIGALLSSLSAGAFVICSTGFDPEEFLGWLEEFQPTWYTAVPAMHQSILLRASRTGKRGPGRLRFIRSCSAALAPKIMKELEDVFQTPVIEAYGMTEASHQMTSNPLPPRKRKPGSVGIASGVAAGIMSEKGELLPPGQIGEVVISGESVTAGYGKNPEANRESFAGKWFRTGDEGKFDEDGYLFLTGRLKEIINRGGEKISPREVDETLLEHPAVAQASAFAVPNSSLGEEVGAVVVLREGSIATAGEIQKFAGARLSHFKTPSMIFIVSEIPKGPTGKIQRRLLASLLGAKETALSMESRAPYSAPRNATEQILAAIWQDVLRLEQPGRNDDFYRAGGDSIAAAKIAARLRDNLGIEVSIADLLLSRTIAEQAELVEKRVAESALLHQNPLALLEEIEKLSLD